MRTAFDEALTVGGQATGDLSASFSSDPFRVTRMVIGAVQYVVSGASGLSGTLKLQASNDAGTDPGTGPAGITGVTNWTDISGASGAVSGNGAGMINLTSMGYRYIRVVWTRSGGSGTIKITPNMKGWE